MSFSKDSPSASLVCRLLLILLLPLHLSAQVAIWTASGPDGPAKAWTDGANWSTGTVPNSPTAVALINTVIPAGATGTGLAGAAPIKTTFTSITLDELRYTAPAGSAGGDFPQLTVSSDPTSLTLGTILQITGAGITLDNAGTSPVHARLILEANTELHFRGSAGIAVAEGSSFSISRHANTLEPSIHFHDNSSAGPATISVSGIPSASIAFHHNSTAASAALWAQEIVFDGQSTAANASLNVHGSGARFSFQDQSSAGNASITLSRLSNLEFSDQTNAGTATVHFAGASVGVVVRGEADISGLILRDDDSPNPQGGGLNISGASGEVSLRAISGLVNVTLGNNTLRLTGDGRDMVTKGAFWGEGGLILDTARTVVISRPDSSYSGPTLIQSGSLHLSSGRVSATTVSPATSLTGTGVVAGGLVNQGVVRPASPQGAALTVSGDYIQAATAELGMQIISGTSFDRLAIGGHAALGGVLRLSLPDPAAFVADVTVEILTAGSISGEFSEVIGLSDHGGRFTTRLVYSPTAVTVEITDVPPPLPTPPLVASQTVTAGQTVSMAAAVIPQATHQWQTSTDGIVWMDLVNDNLHGGVTTATLTITAPTAAQNGQRYRYVMTTPDGTVNSEVSTLTVGPILLPLPLGVAANGAGVLYVTDAAIDTIYRVTADGAVTILAGNSGASGSADGIGADAGFNDPNGIVVTPSGDILVADTANALIRRITTEGVVSTLAGSATQRGNGDGAGADATFRSPLGMAVDAAGNLYVADAQNHTIRRVTASGVVTTLAGGAGVAGNNDGLGSAARFNQPHGIAVDGAGNVYVSDTTNNTLRRITTDGAVTTIAGLAGVSGSSDGAGADALFNQPTGLAIDAAGNLYIADTGNSAIRRLAPDGVVTTLAGLPTVAGLRDGTGAEAWFNQPRGVIVDGDTLYVADTGNAILRRVSLDGVVTTMTLSAGNQPPPPAPPPSQPPPSPPPCVASPFHAVAPSPSTYARILDDAHLQRRRLPQL